MTFPRSQKIILVALIAAAACAARLRAEEPASIRMPPVLWYESYPEQQGHFFMAMLLYWSAQDPNSSFRLLAPLYYSARSGEEDMRILLPFHFHRKDAQSHTDLFGPYFSSRSLKSRTQFLFPIFFRSDSPDSSLMVLPLTVRQKSPDSDYTLVAPFYWSYASKKEGRKSYQLLVPFYMKTRTDENRSIYSPFFWSYRDATVSQTLGIPFYWKSTAEAKSNVVFPVYWRFYRLDEKRSKDIEVAVPWFKYSTPSKSFRTFFPLYWGRTAMNTEEKSTFTAVQNQWDVLFPVFFHSEDAEGNKKWITPLASRFTDPDGTRYGHNGPNFFLYHPWGGKTEVLLPLSYYREDPEFSVFQLTIFGITRAKDGSFAGSSVFPLYSYRRDSDRVRIRTPLFFWDHDPNTRQGLFLNYYWKTEKNLDDPDHAVSERRIFFPLAFHYQDQYERNTVFPPLAAFFNRGDYRLAFVIPFYFDRTKADSRVLFVPPVLSLRSSERKSLSLFFLYWMTERPNRRTVTLFPLYRRSSDAKGMGLYFPAAYYMKREGKSEGGFFPYFWDHVGKTQYEIFFPVYTRFARPKWTLRQALLVYKFRGRTIEEKGFFPIWARTRSVAPSTTSFTTESRANEAGEEEVASSTAPETKHFLADSHRVLPFYFYRKLENGYDLWLPALFSRIEMAQNKEREKMFRVRYLLLGSMERSKSRTVNRMDPLFVFYRNPDAKGFSSPTVPFPLWRYEVEQWQSKTDRKVRGAFFPYYWYRSRSLSRDFGFPIYYRRRERNDEGTKELYRVTWLLNYFSNENLEKSESKTLFVPLYWHFGDPEGALTVVPPLWLERGKNLEREIFFPIYWHSVKNQDRMSLVFPLFYASKNDEQKKKSLIVPGFWKSETRDSKAYLAGNFYHRKWKDKDESLSLFFPLLWSRSAKDERSLSVFPLYWDWRAKDQATQYFFPLYFSQKRPDLSWKILFPLFWRFEGAHSRIKIIPPYFSVLSKDSGTKTSGFAPLWSYAENEASDWKAFELLGGFLGYERRGTGREWTLLYLFKI